MQERLVGQFLVNRPTRDAVFRRSILEAYDNRRAVTGLHILNGGGNGGHSRCVSHLRVFRATVAFTGPGWPGG